MAFGDNFVKAFGKPDPSLPQAMHFTNGAAQVIWKQFKRIGAGGFKDRFLHLFCEGLEELQPCLDAWSFLVPPGHADRMIIGRNAYGAILVLEDGNYPGKEQVHVLDPTTVTYWTDPNFTLMSVIERRLPKDELRNFLDDGLYRKWVQKNKVRPEMQDILGLKQPLPLGGTMELDNVQLENIVEYYESSAPIYAKAFAGLKKSKKKK